MQATATKMGTQPRSLLRSTGALLAGFFAVVVLSLGTDQVLHVLNVYPPWGQSMHEPRLNLLALSYRIVYTVLGSYMAARLAPRNPMRHALILGVIGFVVGSAGAARHHTYEPRAGLVSNCNRRHCNTLRLGGR